MARLMKSPFQMHETDQFNVYFLRKLTLIDVEELVDTSMLTNGCSKKHEDDG